MKKPIMLFVKGGRNSQQGGFVLVLALVVIGLMFAAAAGLSLARQSWGYSSIKELDRSLMEVSVAADSSLWFSGLRAQIQEKALFEGLNKGLDLSSSGQRIESRMKEVTTAWPSLATAGMQADIGGGTNLSGVFTSGGGAYPEYPRTEENGETTWNFDPLFRIVGESQSLSDPMGVRDPYFGSYSYIQALTVLFRREMDDSLFSVRQNRFSEAESKLKAWYSVDGAGEVTVGVRSLSISQFTLFSTQPNGGDANLVHTAPLVLSMSPSAFGFNGATFGGAGALFELSYKPKKPDSSEEEEEVYDYHPGTGELGIGRVYIEGSASVRGTIPLGLPMVITGEGLVDGLRGYAGLFDKHGLPWGGPSFDSAYYSPHSSSINAEVPPVFGFSTFDDYIRWSAGSGRAKVVSAEVSPCRLIRSFAGRLDDGLWENKPLSLYIKDWMSRYAAPQVTLTVRKTQDAASPYEIAWVEDGSKKDLLKSAWELDAGNRTLTFRPPDNFYADQGWSMQGQLGGLPPVVIYLDESWVLEAGEDAEGNLNPPFKIILDVPSVANLYVGAQEEGIPRSGLDRLTVLSIAPVHLGRNFNSDGIDSGTMIVAPSIFVTGDTTEISGIFLTEGPSPLQAFRVGVFSGDVFSVKGGLVLWNRVSRAVGEEFKPVMLKPDKDYISGVKLPYGGRSTVVGEEQWLGPPVVMDVRVISSGLSLYEMKAARDNFGFRNFKEENRQD